MNPQLVGMKELQNAKIECFQQLKTVWEARIRGSFINIYNTNEIGSRRF